MACAGVSEAELGAVAKGAAEGIGLQSLFADFKVVAHPSLKSDAAAAIGIARRLGLGKVRHLSVANLWVQQKLRRKEMVIEELAGAVNASDFMTKPLDAPRIRKLLGLLGVRAIPE